MATFVWSVFAWSLKSFLNVFTFVQITVLRGSSFLTWAPIDVRFCQRATRLCLKRGAFSWRVSSPSPLWLTVIRMLSLWCWKNGDPNSAGSVLGLPHFSVEPQHMSIVANVSLSLSCVAHGPPEPVRVIWLQDGAPLNSLNDPVALSPSRLNLTGIFCHSLTSALTAKNRSIDLNSYNLKWVQWMVLSVYNAFVCRNRCRMVGW